MLQLKLKEFREQRRISQAALAKAIGVGQSTVAMWESGKSRPEYETLMKLAHYFDVTVDELTSEKPKENSLPPNVLALPKMVKKPLLGTIACGQPILATENVDEYIDVPETIHCDFVLRCKGDSMIDARIYDGDVVYIQQQEHVENGQIAAVLVDGVETEATLKRIYLNGDNITLMAENRNYAPIVFTGESMNQVRIIGKAVAFTSRVR